MKKLQSLTGMDDLLPGDSRLWQWLEGTVADVFGRYGYREIRAPLLESTDLFVRSIGEVTDIVGKEMYTFQDMDGDSVTLRPEGTAGVVRAALENGLLHNQIQKLWYCGPMFRHEKPQKGRRRQFHQMGVEVFGLEGPDVDAELIALTARLWKELGIADKTTLQINTLATPGARAHYREQLVIFLNGIKDQLDEDSQRRVDSNPLRVLDSKEPATQALLADAPQLLDCLDEESQQHFDQLRRLLDNMQLAYEVNPRLVRGLDYYSKTVFEWVTDALGSQGTICGGGRYDGLVAQLGGKAVPAVGFGMGLERLALLLEQRDDVEQLLAREVDLYLMHTEETLAPAMVLAERVREQVPGLKVQTHFGPGNIKNQIKKADKSGALYALILGDEEQANGTVTLKFLREEKPQQTESVDQIIDLLAQQSY